MGVKIREPVLLTVDLVVLDLIEQSGLGDNHESRSSSYRAEEAVAVASEETPLLRFPRPPGERNPVSTAVVSTLLVILIAGVIIGVYLLIQQSQSENILPPVDAPLKLASRYQWDPSEGSNLAQSGAALRASRVILVQTDSDRCYTAKTCEKLLRELKENLTGESKVLPYNFLVSSDGQTYESLGWRSASPLFPGESAVVLGFIGNFTTSPPTDAQIAESKTFFAAAVSRQHLDPNFTIVGKKTQVLPKYLFSSFKDMSQWNDSLSDKS